jgi:DNA-binding NtrC family response regulator
LFEVADNGSIFLDEIGDVPPEMQVRLLRVIQEREFTPIGDTQPHKVDVRIIAATNADLKELVRQGTFREDLYYRLSVVPLNCRRSENAAKIFCRSRSILFANTTKKTREMCRKTSTRKF